MLIALPLLLRSQANPRILTDEDKAMIEATVSEKKRKWGHRIWLVEDTMESSRFDRMLSQFEPGRSSTPGPSFKGGETDG